MSQEQYQGPAVMQKGQAKGRQVWFKEQGNRNYTSVLTYQGWSPRDNVNKQEKNWREINVLLLEWT